MNNNDSKRSLVIINQSNRSRNSLMLMFLKLDPRGLTRRELSLLYILEVIGFEPTASCLQSTRSPS